MMDSIEIGQLIDHEMRVWQSLSHANVLPFIGVCRKITPLPALVSPLYNNSTVNRYVLHNPQVDRLAIVSHNHIPASILDNGLHIIFQIIGVARGLEYIHSENVVHGDLKCVRDYKFVGQLSVFNIRLTYSAAKYSYR